MITRQNQPGCWKCQHGLIDPPLNRTILPLYLARIRQAIGGQLTFCDCPAGQARRNELLDARLTEVDARWIGVL